MSARFTVRSAFPIESRCLFVLRGTIGEGTIRTGMLATLSGEGEGEFEAQVHTVEFLDRPDGDGGGATEPALTFHYSTDEKLERWSAIDWVDREVALSW